MTPEQDAAKKAYMREYMQAYRKAHKNQPKRINLTVTNSEYVELCRLSKKEKKPLTRLVKELALVALYERDNFPQPIEQELHNISLILRGIANNINQMARYAHSVRRFSEDQELALKLRLLEDQIHTFIQSKQLRNTYDNKINGS